MHHFVWFASQFPVLGDAGNGVVTTRFIVDDLPTWNLTAHVPGNIAGVLAALEGGGLPAYTNARPCYFADTAWGHYTTAYAGGSGDQSGFCDIVSNPALMCFSGSAGGKRAHREHVGGEPA